LYLGLIAADESRNTEPERKELKHIDDIANITRQPKSFKEPEWKDDEVKQFIG